VKKPQVVLADEPTANLDTETAIKTIEAFQVMQKSEKVSFIFSTHDATLMSYAKQVYRMKSGLIETVTA
jgi:ABC-type lipoprotein export system ATPase subunit